MNYHKCLIIGIQSFLASSRQAVVCRPTLQTQGHHNASVDYRTLSCPSQEDPEINGNLMQYNFERNNRRLVVEYIDIGRCGESPPNECRCKSMLEYLLISFVDEIKATFQNRGTGTIPDATYLKMCRCFLGAAARSKFKTVAMLHPGPQKRCNEEKNISTNKLSSDFYGKVCKKLSKQGCEEMDGTIRKIRR